MGMGSGGDSLFGGLFRRNIEITPEQIAAEAARIRAEGGTPLGEDVTRTVPTYTPPTQTTDYANPIPQYQPSRFDFNPYAAAYQQQFNSMPPVQAPQMPTQPVSGLGALAQLYGMYNAAPQDSASQDAHAASIASAANTTI